MKEYNRLQNSFFSLASGMVYRIITLLTAFVVRTVFVNCLSTDYLGVNGLCTNILSMLSLAELGFGTAMVYSMYKPLAEKDYNKLQQLMDLYKKVYAIIGTVILVLGLCLVPFLDLLVKDKPRIDGFSFYYLLFLLDAVVSYWFFAYRSSLLTADQKMYMVTNYNTAFNIIKSVLQIIMLLAFHNFAIYVIIQIICTVGQNICIALKVNRMYPIFKKNKSNVLPKGERNKIFRDVKALMFTKVGHIALNSTDNIIVSAFVGITQVGLLSNYLLITNAVTAVLTQVTGALMGSLGNYFAKEDKASGYGIFKKVEFLNFWLYGFSTICIITLLNPFITIWLGESYKMPFSVVIWTSINFFVAGFLNTLYTFRSTLGLFTQGQYRPIIVAALNIVLSIVFSQFWGVSGILAATFVSRACVNLWYDPWLVHKYGFNVSVKPFLKKYMFRIPFIVVITVATVWISNLIFLNGVTLWSFVLVTIITAVLPNILFLLCYRKDESFKYFLDIVRNRLLGKLIKGNNN
ncbi:lipopolysaccharide biosynthesis protein [Oscillospiraceae bacterium LCP25S3_E10]|nr:MATE family efflux transporter [Ruminococcus sp.]MDY2856818.1 MATE family efflux transporter [Oscillospiraceae bacterium]